jgi:hypothetical protein
MCYTNCNNMGSINAQRVAMKLSETVKAGKLVDLEDIIISCGYSATTAKRPKQVTETKAFKKTMEIQSKPLLEGLQSEINRMKLALSRKDLSQEDARTIIYGIDILVKNYQLLSGGATERQVFVLPSEVIKRNEIETSEDKQMLNNGSTEP